MVSRAGWRDRRYGRTCRRRKLATVARSRPDTDLAGVAP